MENDMSTVLMPLFAAVLLSFVIERALAVVFDIPKVEEWVKVRGSSLKGMVAAAVAVTICIAGDLDVVSSMLKYGGATNAGELHVLGNIITGIFIAGGSQGSVKLFQDVLGFSKEQRDRVDDVTLKQLAVDELKLEREALQSKAEIAQLQVRLQLLAENDVSLDAERLARLEEAVARINEARGHSTTV